MGGFLPDPVKSEKYRGHYKTYLESSRDCDKYTNVNDTEHGRCAICPNWIFSSATEEKRHCKLLHPDENLCTLKKSKEKKSYKCNYNNSQGNVCGQEFKTYHRLYKHKKLNSHTRNRLQKVFKETERISHSKKKIRTQKESLTESKHVVQDTVDTEQERRSSDSDDIESSYGDDNLENDEGVADLCEANICKIKTSKVKGIEYNF